MCLRPVHIRNRGVRHNVGTYFLDVPCGHCEECQNVKSIDYFIRAWSEYSTLCAGPDSSWSAFFVTFTYNEESVPRSDFYRCVLSDDETDFEWKKEYDNIRVFNHEHIKTFLKSFAQFYRRRDLPAPKCLFTCEFGEDNRYTHRPHYHGAILVPERISYKEFNDIVLRFWHYGFVKNIALKQLDGVVKDRSPINCFRYVVKYACKGSSYLPEPYLRKKDFVPSLDDWYNLDVRIFTTNHFGSALEKLLCESNFKQNSVSFCVGSHYQEFVLPVYYRRRHYVKDKVLCSGCDLVGPIIYPFRTIVNKPKKKYWKRQFSEYINGYGDIKKDSLITSVRKKYFDCFEALKSNRHFVSYLDTNGELDNIFKIISDNKILDKEKFVECFMSFHWSDTSLCEKHFQYKSVSTDTIIPQKDYVLWSFLQSVKSSQDAYLLGIDDSFSLSDKSKLDFFRDLPQHYNLLYEHPVNSDFGFIDESLVVPFFITWEIMSLYDDFCRRMRSDKLFIKKIHEKEFLSGHFVVK